MIVADLGVRQPAAPLDEQHARAGLGEHARRDASARARADHDHVVGVGDVVEQTDVVSCA